MDGLMEEMRPQPVFPFVVGAARSGTTLLRVMLSAGTRLTIPSEGAFVHELLSHPADEPVPPGWFAEVLRTDRLFHRWPLSVEQVEAELTRRAPVGPADVLRIVHALEARERGRRMYGHKTPNLVLRLPALTARLPEARIVHIVRDGRDVALSHLDTEGAIDSLTEAAVVWRRNVLTGHRAGASLGPDRYREVRYERLVAAPEEEMRELCSFLGIEYEPRMLRFHERIHDILGREDLGQTNQALGQPITEGRRDWRRDMRTSQVAVFEALAGDALDVIGYARATSRPRYWARVASRVLRPYLAVRIRVRRDIDRALRWPPGG